MAIRIAAGAGGSRARTFATHAARAALCQNAETRRHVPPACMAPPRTKGLDLVPRLRSGVAAAPWSAHGGCRRRARRAPRRRRQRRRLGRGDAAAA